MLQQNRLANLDPVIEAKLTELKEGIDLRANQGAEAATKMFTTQYGKSLMNEIEKRVAEAQEEEERLLIEREQNKTVNAETSFRAAVVGSLCSAALLVMAFIVLKKEIARRARLEKELVLHQSNLQKTVAERTLELQETNARLGQQQKWLQTTLRSIGDAVITTNVDGVVTSVNPVAEELTGWNGKRGVKPSFGKSIQHH